MSSWRAAGVTPLYETPPANDGHVIIAGFGRYGQIVARVLRAKGIPFTALDINAEQVEFVKKFGSEAFFGDASRPDILEAAEIDKARAFVLAIDDVEASVRTAEMVTSRWPKLPLYARARNRNHAHRLLDLGVKNIQRETFLSSLETTRQRAGRARALRPGGRAHDRHVPQPTTSGASARTTSTTPTWRSCRRRRATTRRTLEKLFAEDAVEEAKLAAAAPADAKERAR